jgi:hypothetical protein
MTLNGAQSIELHASVRNSALYLESPRNGTAENLNQSEILMTALLYLCLDEHTGAVNWDDLKNGRQCCSPSCAASCADLSFQWIQIGPQLVPGNSRDTFDLQDPQRRDFVPLCDSLLGDTQ